jgi:acyl carrier protein
MPDPKLVSRIAQIVRNVGKLDPGVTIEAPTRLVEDLGIDSLDLVGIFLMIQDELTVAIEEADVPSLVTIGDLAGYVQKRLPSSSSAAA